MWLGPTELAELAAEWVGPGGALFVDYLQKVPVTGAKDDGERVLRVAESLKETAMAHDVCVVAAAAVNAQGLGDAGIEDGAFTQAAFDEAFQLVTDTIVCGRVGSPMPAWSEEQGGLNTINKVIL